MRSQSNAARLSIPIKTHKAQDKRGMFIDEEFQNIINKECPGKLYKLLRQRFKKRIFTQPSTEIPPENQKQTNIFERTIYKQRLKTAQKDKRAQSMRHQLKTILKMNQRPPSPFFKLNRHNILQLQRSSLELQSQRYKESNRKSIKSHETGRSNRTSVHPYMKIAKEESEYVSKQMSRRSKQKDSKFTKFEPFGDIQPIDIVY